jgi:hypothetical protein
MNDIVVHESQPACNSNLAQFYVRLPDGFWCKQLEQERTDDFNNSISASKLWLASFEAS